MFATYTRFIRGVSFNWYGKLGVTLTTSSFITLIILESARILGIITSSYAGLVTYMVFPALFVIGLILIPIGWLRYRKQAGRSPKELVDARFGEDSARAGFFGSRLFKIIGLLTLLNIVFLTSISARMLHFMDSPRFCGTACHSVMNPEWTTYQQSPHARVRCVDCHVGEGADALIDSKLNGLYQIVSVTFDLLERPIPTPVHQLRPARETCEKCHWPERFYGSRLRTYASYDLDEMSTPLYTTLNLKIDAGRQGSKAGIHWHVSEQTEVRYASVGDEREEIIWIEVIYSDGAVKRYANPGAAQPDDSEARVMDCVDCHNRATHVYEDPERAVDDRMSRGMLDRTIPYLKREALHAVSNDYGNRPAGLMGITNHITGFYQRSLPETAQSRFAAIDSAAEVLQAIYNRNIHPEMNITWGTYPSQIGHRGKTGCFRCHNSKLVDEEGNAVSYDCVLCHSILADRHEVPFRFLLPADSTDPEFERHRYLRDEFIGHYGE